MSDLRTVDFNRNEPKSVNHFIPPKKSPSNIRHQHQMAYLKTPKTAFMLTMSYQ